MTRLTLPKLTFMVAVAALVLALWPIFGNAPWELPRTENERRAEEYCERLGQRSNFVIRPALKLMGKTTMGETVYQTCMGLPAGFRN